MVEDSLKKKNFLNSKVIVGRVRQKVSILIKIVDIGDNKGST